MIKKRYHEKTVKWGFCWSDWFQTFDAFSHLEVAGPPRVCFGLDVIICGCRWWKRLSTIVMITKSYKLPSKRQAEQITSTPNWDLFFSAFLQPVFPLLVASSVPNWRWFFCWNWLIKCQIWRCGDHLIHIIHTPQQERSPQHPLIIISTTNRVAFLKWYAIWRCEMLLTTL